VGPTKLASKEKKEEVKERGNDLASRAGGTRTGHSRARNKRYIGGEEDQSRLFAVRSGLATTMQVARVGTYETRDIIGKHRSRLRLRFKQGLIKKKGQRMGTTIGHLMI
jgi:hypothetical protein